MTPSLGYWAGAVAALAAIIGVLWLLARLARASGLVPAARARRIGIVESLPLDTRRRAVLLRCDGREVLLLTGGGQDVVVGWLPAAKDDTA